MEIFTEVVNGVTVVSLVGELDGSTAPQVQGEILALIGPQSRILLNMTDLVYMSSAGARVLLMC